MGTVAGLRTRRYHGLLAVAAGGPAAPDARASSRSTRCSCVGDARVRLATDEWACGAVDPRGHELLVSFDARRTACRAGAGRSATSCSSASSRWRTAAPRSASSTGCVRADRPVRARADAALHLAERPRRALRGRATRRSRRPPTASSSRAPTASPAPAGGRAARGTAASARARRRPAGLNDREDLWAAGRLQRRARAGRRRTR